MSKRHRLNELLKHPGIWKTGRSSVRCRQILSTGFVDLDRALSGGWPVGVLVELLESPQEVGDFFGRHPKSLVLVQEKSTDLIFSGDEALLREHVQRELWVGKTLYLVLRNHR